MSETAALITTGASTRRRAKVSALAEFEDIYRTNIGALTGFFARRCADPQTVADLASETFLRAAAGFLGFDSSRGTPRGWLFGIAGHVYAQHCAQVAAARDSGERLAGQMELPPPEIEDLIARIDAAREGCALVERLAALSSPEREAVELVDIDGLSPKDAATALGISRGVLRMRLHRGRSRLR